MKQDKAEAKAVASALPYGLRMLQGNAPQADCLAPGFDIAPDAAAFVGPMPPEFVGPVWPIHRQMRAQFDGLKDFFIHKASNGLYAGAQDAEWARVPLNWRITLMMLGGIGEMDSIDYLAGRSWQELPPREREAVKFAAREGKRILGGLRALTLRTGE